MKSVKGCAPMTGGCLPAKTWHNFMAPALKDVPVTDFKQPAPIKIITDKLSQQARTGIDPGAARKPASTGIGGPYQVGPAAPTAEAPAASPTTTTTAPASGSTTTTARPPGPGSTTTTARPLIGGGTG
jgi:membrane peptidoglycan carboxypeptidase